jgi:hypothetical protein
MGNNGKAYLLGGRVQTNVCEYDPWYQNWNCTRAVPPIKLHHMQCVAVGNEIWIPSAWTGNYPRETNVDRIYIYNTATNVWSNKPGLAEPRRRGGAAAVYYDGSIYLSHGNRGGHGEQAEALAYFDQYNIAMATWTALPNALYPRDHTGGAIVNGTWLCVAAGRDGGVSGFFNATILQTECYDLSAGANGNWTTKANITQGRAGSAYGTTCDGKLMVAGGEGFKKAWKNVDVFDGETWTAWDDLVGPRHGSGLAVSCNCGASGAGAQQVHVAVGRATEGGGTDLTTTETLFPNGVNVPCIPQTRRLLMEELVLDDKTHTLASRFHGVRAPE